MPQFNHPPLENEFRKKQIEKFIGRLEWIIKELRRNPDSELSIEFLESEIKRLIAEFPRREPRTTIEPDGGNVIPKSRKPLTDEHRENISKGVKDAQEEKEAVKDGMRVEQGLQKQK